MKAYNWFKFTNNKTNQTMLFTDLVRLSIGIGFASLLLYLGHVIPAIIVFSITVILSVLFITSPLIRKKINMFFIMIRKFLGKIISLIILTPVFYLFFPIARVFNKLRGNDPLLLRSGIQSTYWQKTEPVKKKVKYLKYMFARERTLKGQNSILIVLILLVVTFLFAEAILRSFGFGNPVLYVSDTEVGYYPAPNQETFRYGGNRISINNYGMRAPDISYEKADNTIRILLIGDSTLYGGSYIDQDALYARLLENKLNEIIKLKEIEVLNIGVNAWGPLHKSGYIKKFGTFEADIIIVCMPIGDIYRNKYGLPSLPYMSVKNPPILAIEEVFVHLIWRYRRGMVNFPSLSAKEGIIAYAQLARLLSANGAEVFFEILPSKAVGLGLVSVDPDFQIINDFKQVLELNGFAVYYPGNLFKDENTSANLYHDGCHLDKEGHWLYSEYLVDKLLSSSEIFKEIE